MGVLEGSWGALEESSGVMWVLKFFEGGLGGSWVGFGPIFGGVLGRLWGPMLGGFGVILECRFRSGFGRRLGIDFGPILAPKTAPK